MRTILILFLASVSSALAFESDPRNTAQYHVIFDLETRGSIDLVNGYGAYVQIYEPGPAKQYIRYCENFEGHGPSGRPNKNRERYKLIPVGVVDPTAYHCRDFSLADVAIGQPLIAMGDKKFFSMKSATWSAKDGGDILFQFAQKLPVIGAPKYKTLRVRAVRKSGALEYTVGTVIPKGEIAASHFFRFDVSGSGLGFPNGITALTIDPNENTQKSVDIDGLEGPISIRGTGDGRTPGDDAKN